MFNLQNDLRKAIHSNEYTDLIRQFDWDHQDMPCYKRQKACKEYVKSILGNKFNETEYNEHDAHWLWY